MEFNMRALSLWRQKFETLMDAQAFRAMALLFAEAPYGWGRENIKETDCSGLISGTLYLLGFKVRVTADFFYRNIFEETSEEFADSEVKCVFIKANKDYQTPDGIRKAGTIRHMGILMDDDVVFHAAYVDGTKFDSLENFEKMAKNLDSDVVIKALNWDLVKHFEGTVYGLDEELS